MPAIVKSHAGKKPAGFVNFARYVVLRMSGRHQHARQHGDGFGATPYASGNAVPDDWTRELQKPALDDPPGLLTPEVVHQPTELFRAFRVPAAMSHEQKG